MTLLTSILTAATLISSFSPLQPDNSCADLSILQPQINNQYITGQIIIGNNSCLESVLDKLCINLDDLLNGCLPPTLPDTEVPAPSPEGNPPSENIPDANLSFIEQVVSLVNAERQKVGLPALTISDKLNNAAQIRSIEIKQSFSHTRPDGSSFSTVLSENNISYRSAGENIAWGQKTPEEVVNAWMNSAGHRANILNKNYTTIGVGYYLSNNTPYWAQLFTY